MNGIDFLWVPSGWDVYVRFTAVFKTQSETPKGRRDREE